MSRSIGPDDLPRMQELSETDFAPDNPYLAEWHDEPPAADDDADDDPHAIDLGDGD